MASRIRPMAALPADPEHGDSLDPERILRVLPEDERETFLTEYRHAVGEAHDPAAWKDLQQARPKRIPRPVRSRVPASARSRAQSVE